MEFTQMSATEYRALEDAELNQRKSMLIELMNMEALPEGVSDEQLFAERDLIIEEINRRNKVNELRNAQMSAVLNGGDKVIASSEPTKQKRTSEVKMVSTENFTSSLEYRQALAKHIMHTEPMPSEYLARAVAEKRAATNPIDVPGEYTNLVDTLTNTYSSLVAVPTTVSDEVVRELKERGTLHQRVNITNYQGGVIVPVSDLAVEATWLGSDKVVSEYQEDTDPDYISFTWKQAEIRFARTFLANALMGDNFKNILADAFAEALGFALDNAIVNGNGTTEPTGITKDVKIIGTDGTGLDGDGKGLIVEASQADIEDWTFWAKLLYNPKFNRLYRQGGEWILGDGTWGLYVDTLKDDNNRPIAKFNPLDEDLPMRLRGNGVNTVPNTILKDFDSAEVGDIFGIFGNLKHYTLNYQPGMPINTVSWDDHDTNTQKTKMLTFVDGKVSNPYGWLLLKKKASA